MLLSVRAESNQRRAKGAPSTNTWLTPVFIGVAPLDPHFTGDALLRDGKFYPAGKDKSIWSFLPRGHWPLPGQKFQSVCAVRTPPTLAKPWQLGSCGRHPPDHRRTQQVGMQEAGCVRAARL